MQLTLPIRENNPEIVTRVSVPVVGASQEKIDNLRDAILGVILGKNDEGQVTTTTRTEVLPASTDPVPNTAQSGQRYRVFLQNTNGGKGYFEVPTANPALLPVGSRFLALASGAGATFKTALDNNVAVDGVAAKVQKVKFVTRKAY